MFYLLDVLVYVLYTAYKETKYDTPELHTSQSRIILGMSISVLGGMFLNYLLIYNSLYYMKYVDEHNLLFIIYIIYIFILYKLITKRYTDEKILNIVSKHSNVLSVSLARFLSFVFCTFFIGIVMMLLVFTAYAFEKR